MKTINFKNGITAKVYDSIDEMPIINFQKYNKYLLIDAGLGSDIDSVDEHIVAVAKYISKGDKVKAVQELQNLRQNLHLITNELSPRYLAFAALIYSINGKEIQDYSDEGLKDTLKKLTTVKHSMFTKLFEEIKKKVSSELELYFPTDFTDAREKEAYDRLKRKVQLQLDSIITEREHTDEISEIDEFMFNLHKPKSFSGQDSVEIAYDKQFENACLLISQEANLDAKKMTVLQFYNTLNNLKKQAEAKAKAYKKR